ncbi:hypothetical protein [Paenibacillus senegalimassiliensis]|uniref:hypothetical protein n=1 Tax=Paenibacillus senegalimassiliensis TaxID=1737426 RepID=UPI00073F2BD2|nr:hypothetical protein [Paenibacillus senegalimassiliensis]
METTICPWCQTEIVWDEELGPEEECPHCHNELKGYRTLSITLGEDNDFEDEAEDHPFNDRKHQHDEEDQDDDNAYWDDEEETSQVGGIHRLGALAAAGGDLLKYESGVEKLLDGQEEVPECPHCREYMLYAGKQPLTAEHGFGVVQPAGLKGPLLPDSAELNVYVCTACFHVSRFLTEEARLSLMRVISGEEES